MKKYQPTYHAHVNEGWSNDPNGLIYYKDAVHLFFQHYPHEPRWGIMHWGHYTSYDMIKWDPQPIALFPDQPYEEILGCWSGTAITKDDRLYLMYTGSTPEYQTQCLAFSDDGVHFTKYEHNPVIRTEQLPDIADKKDFRDPKVFMADGRYYALMGSKINGYGNIVLYTSENLTDWSYVGYCLHPQDHVNETFYRLEGVYECPDFFHLGDYDVILTSPQHLPQIATEHQNRNSTLYLIGHLNLQTGQFDIVDLHEIDAGFDFYAPQTLTLPDGRIVMMAWKELWFRTFPTVEHGWIGSYTLPRVLTIKDDRLYQEPVAEIIRYRQNKVSQDHVVLNKETMLFPDFAGNKSELLLTIDLSEPHDFTIELFKHADHTTTLTYDHQSHQFILDRSRMGLTIEGRDEDACVRRCQIDPVTEITLRIFMDVSALEIFINDGRYVMTANIYGDEELDQEIAISTPGRLHITHMEKYDIIV